MVKATEENINNNNTFTMIPFIYQVSQKMYTKLIKRNLKLIWSIINSRSRFSTPEPGLW